YNARASAAVAAVDARTSYLVSLPAGHNFPLACPGILGTLLAGGRVVTLPSPEPARAFATIAAEGVTHTAVVPAVAGRWLEHAGPTPRAATTKRPSRTPVRSPPTAGTAPATSAGSRPRATSSSRAGTRT